jgi:hypothetical protein
MKTMLKSVSVLLLLLVVMAAQAEAKAAPTAGFVPPSGTVETLENIPALVAQEDDFGCIWPLWDYWCNYQFNCEPTQIWNYGCGVLAPGGSRNNGVGSLKDRAVKAGAKPSMAPCCRRYRT